MNRFNSLTTNASTRVIALALGLVSTVSFAQEENVDANLEEVIVVGKYQASLQSALERKRGSASVIEAISAEDIGQLPDVSITESLARLPGVAQDRDRGNGSQISIRGMGGQLGLTTLNGREVATVEEDRNIRYDQFPSELINAAQVYKTPQAKIAEGGVSGTVNLETISPLDYDERVIAVNLRGSSYSLGKDIDDAAGGGIGTRYSVSYIDKFADDTLGVAIGIAGQNQPIATQRAELWNYGDTWHNTQWNDEEGKNFNAPWGGSALVRGGEDSRVGGMAVVQWEPTENFALSYDFFYSQLDISEEQRGFDFNIDPDYARQWDINDSVATQFTNSDENAEDVLSAHVGLSSLRSLNEKFTQTDDLMSHGLTADWFVGGWNLVGAVSHSATNRDRMWQSVRTVNTSENLGGTFGANSDDRMTFALDTGIDLTDPAQNRVDNLTVNPLSVGEDAITAIEFSAERELNGSFFSSFEVGARVSERVKKQDAQTWDQFVVNNWDVALTDEFIIDAGAKSYWSDLPDYLTIDREAVIDYYFGSIENPTPGDNDDLLASWEVSEDIQSAYVQLNIDTQLGSIPMRGNVGVRAVTTTTGTKGYQVLSASTWVEEPVGSGVWVEVLPSAEQVETEHSYDDFLPSVNLAFELRDDLVLRLGAAKTIARAPLDFLSPAVDIGQDQWAPNPGESASGNPYLEPFRATQGDTTLEWYFGDSNSIAATLYYKDMESYIARQAGAESITVDGTDYLLSLPVNGSGGYIKGYEISYQQAFDFLPGPFSGLGVYANYANTSSNIEQGTPLNATPFGLTGLSEDVGTFTLWHYLNGFESRLSYNYRSEFQRDISRVAGEEGVNAAEGYMDLAFSYELNENVKLMLQVQNLTDEPYKVYGLESNNPNHINKFEEFGQRYSFGISWKL